MGGQRDTLLGDFWKECLVCERVVDVRPLSQASKRSPERWRSTCRAPVGTQECDWRLGTAGSQRVEEGLVPASVVILCLSGGRCERQFQRGN